MPRISVLMGVYHPGGDTADLCRSVESILSQSFTDFEFLICDDGSGEAAKNVLETFAGQDARIRLIRPGGVFPLPNKLNCCIRASSGKYLARQDADDLSHPDRLAKQALFLDHQPQSAFCGCNVSLFDKTGPQGERLFPAQPTTDDFLFSMPYIHPTLVFRREAVEAVHGYSESNWAVLCEDYDLLLRLYQHGYPGANLQEILFSYQISPDDHRKRTYRHRVNEAVIRFQRFRELGMMPRAIPYVIKPLIVGLLPHQAVEKLKKARSSGSGA